MNKKTKILNEILDSAEAIRSSVSLFPEIERSIKIIVQCFKRGNKVVLFGNGGSATDAQHIAAEFIGRFNIKRRSLPALALTTDSSILTSLSNDYSFDVVFSRQCESLVKKGDVVIGISTSGNSKNVKNGIMVAKKKGATTIGLLGNKGGQIKRIVDVPIVVNSTSTPRVQEVHRTLSHIICEFVEKEIIKN
jgi:D-sedoheptulose 7-phosphate isomerase